MDLFPMFLGFTWPFTILCLIHAFVNCDGVDAVTSTYNNPKIKLIKITNYTGICPKRIFQKLQYLCIFHYVRFEQSKMTIDIGNLFYLKTIGQKHHMYMYLLAAVNKKHWCLRMHFLIFFYQHMKNAYYTRIC